jgi:transcriptional regulator with XRE-family HTH domain
MNPVQFRMAKAALDLSNRELAEATGIHRNTLNAMDNNKASPSTASHLRLWLEARGIEFLGSDGVRMPPPD